MNNERIDKERFVREWAREMLKLSEYPFQEGIRYIMASCGSESGVGLEDYAEAVALTLLELNTDFPVLLLSAANTRSVSISEDHQHTQRISVADLVAARQDADRKTTDS